MKGKGFRKSWLPPVPKCCYVASVGISPGSGNFIQKCIQPLKFVYYVHKVFHEVYDCHTFFKEHHSI